MRIIKLCFLYGIVALFTACATYEPQFKDGNQGQNFPENKEIAHSVYLIGDAGNSPIGKSSKALELFKEALNKADANSTALFLGDNIYPDGLPKKDEEGRAFAEYQLDIQIAAAENFKGKAILIPGNHDWYSDGLEGLKRQERYVEDGLGKNSFLPEDGCPLKKVSISNQIELIVIDSEWYLTNWDKHPTMNDDCEIKTRAKFLDELEGLIKKARGKTTIIALHHPMFTNGSHGGQYSVGSHMKPAPILGTLKNIIRKTGGVTTVDLQNRLYEEFRERIITLAQENDKTIFVSGHDHNLQYIVEDNLPQIVSGAGSKKMATRNLGGGLFSYGAAGYARLDIFSDGSSHVRFYAVDDDLVYQAAVLPEDKKSTFTTYPTPNKTEKTSSVYTKEEVEKSGFYKSMWGDRYREYYGTEVTVPTVNLDTLFGGLTPVRKGGGHQSSSVRLLDKDGREYVMRAIRKNALQYLQAVAFKDQYIEGKFKNTFVEALLLDVFTGAHPYAPFAIPTLSEAAGIFHTKPVLYYVPKQNALENFNEEFGNALYMIEERAGDGHGEKANFGFSDELISTDDLLKNLTKNEDHILDEKAYIRARLFDMLIGDWDRHEDQWRWAVFKEEGQTVYRPVPRDRDQAFSIMADGFLLGLATRVVPALRLMQSYEEELKSPKWFNLEPYPLDVALIEESDKSVWDAEVQHLVSNITDAVIEEAFKNLPDEVNDQTLNEIKGKLKGRRANLQGISDAYFNHINKYAVIKGTDKDDWFEIERKANGQTSVTAYRIKKGEKGPVFQNRTYSSDTTKEIWIYGLDDDDVYQVTGDGNQLIKLRLVGGQNNDTYIIENGAKVIMYDYKSKKNEFTTNKGRKVLTDRYATNVYDYKKLQNSANMFVPSIGANPDDGFKFGFANTYIFNGFERNPFTSKHVVSAGYYFATNGYILSYDGEFANVIGKANLELNIQFHSPNFAENFFGFGNETPNPEADENDGFDTDLDFNRVKIRSVKATPNIVWRGRMGSITKLGVSYESNEVERTPGRFLESVFSEDDILFDDQNFVGAEGSYHYSNTDSDAFPTLGFFFDMVLGYKHNTRSSDGFGYFNPQLAFDHKITSDGQLVFATRSSAQFNFGDDFEFYQAANLGADTGLRGFRNQRFSGKTAFVQTTDVRVNLRKAKSGFLPLNFGFYGGFDYGRVWLDDEDSDKWHNSIGGGIFANAANIMTFNLSAFNSDDGVRLAFRMGFGF